MLQTHLELMILKSHIAYNLGESKTHENTVITLTVGVLDNHVTVPNVVGMNLEEATSTLNENNITYRIEYKKTNAEDDNIVISQSVKANKKIENTEIVTITVAKNIKNNNNNNPIDDNSEQEENNNNSETNDPITNE